MTSNSFQNEVPKARVNIKLDLHTGGGAKKGRITAEVDADGGLQ